MLSDKEDLERAFNKELFIIKNDLYYQQIERVKNGKKELLRIDIAYQPHSALSGDTYSLRKTKEGKIVGFIADAMGKGVSAALTSMGTTRFLNYLFDELEEEKIFSFELWIQKFLKFIKKNILDDEMLSITFMEFDIEHSILRYAIFGMPAFLIATQEREIIAIKSNNPPIMKYTDNIHIDALPTASFSRMLCFSDGLCESFTTDNHLYSSFIREDFLKSSNIDTFRAKVHSRIEKPDDDITYIYVQKLDVYTLPETIVMQSTYEAQENTLSVIAEYIKHYGTSSKCSSEIILALSELLLNALEHGSFGINKEHKNTLIANNLFDEEVLHLEREYSYKTIEIQYGIFCTQGKELFEARIIDSGEGFDTRILKDTVVNAEHFNGRGFVIVKKLLDYFYFNEKGNAITIRKFLELQ